MNKGAIICKLHEIIDHYLLGGEIGPLTGNFCHDMQRRSVRHAGEAT